MKSEGADQHSTSQLTTSSSDRELRFFMGKSRIFFPDFRKEEKRLYDKQSLCLVFREELEEVNQAFV